MGRRTGPGEHGEGRSATGGPPFASAELEPPEGSLPALSSDGLIESAGHDVDAGLTLLAGRPPGPPGAWRNCATTCCTGRCGTGPATTSPC